MSLFNTLIPAFARAPAQHASTGAADLGPTVKPAYEIKENDEAFALVVQLPGVTKDGLELTAEEGQFRIVGGRTWKQPEGWTALYRESAGVPFELVLTHDHAIDAERIAAELRDGVLRVSLPKHEALKPRKIAVT